MKPGDILKVRIGDEVILAWVSMTGPKGKTQPTAKMAKAVVVAVHDQGQIECRGKIPSDLWTPEAVHYQVESAKEHLRTKIAGFIRQWQALHDSIQDLEIRP